MPQTVPHYIQFSYFENIALSLFDDLGEFFEPLPGNNPFPLKKLVTLSALHCGLLLISKAVTGQPYYNPFSRIIYLFSIFLVGFYDSKRIFIVNVSYKVDISKNR